MQNSEKKIDNLFQDKFADYMVVPPVEVWNKIEASLDEKKKKRRTGERKNTFFGSPLFLHETADRFHDRRMNLGKEKLIREG